jgi:hypothetical protein
MKQNLLLLAALLGVGFTTQAQNTPRFGIMGGLQSASIRSTISSDGKFGIHLGGVAEIPVSEQFVIRPQLLYSMKGGSSFGSSVSLNYIELPVHAVYKAEVGNGKLFGGIGPYFGFLAGATDEDGDKIDDINSFDAGFSLLGGYELTENKLAFNLFYNSGLTNLNTGSSISVTNGTFGLSVAYFFGD